MLPAASVRKYNTKIGFKSSKSHYGGNLTLIDSFLTENDHRNNKGSSLSARDVPFKIKLLKRRGKNIKNECV